MNIRRSDIVFFFAMLVAVYVAWLALPVLLLIYVSALFAVVITPAIEAVQRIAIGRWHPGRGAAITMIIGVAIVLVFFFFAFALPPMFHDLQGLAAVWPQRVSQLTDMLHRIPVAGELSIASLERPFTGLAGGVLEIFKQFASSALWFFTWLVLTAYFIADGKRAFRWFLSLFPAPASLRLETTLLRCQGRVRHWLVGQGLLMLIFGLLSALVFGLLRVKYSYVLAVFAGLGNIVPIVGPIASVVLACIVAGFDSWTKAAAVLVFYFVYAQVEHAYLTPRIMKTTLNLPALAVIIALSTGGILAGVLGALIALPTAAIIAVFADEYLVKPNQAATNNVPADAAKVH